MAEILTFIKDTPVPTFLVAAAILSLLLGCGVNFLNLAPDPQKHPQAKFSLLLVGAVFLVVGISLVVLVKNDLASVDAVQAEMARLQQVTEGKDNEIAAANTRIGELSEEAANLKQVTEGKDNEIAAANTRIGELSEEAANLRKLLGARAGAIHRFEDALAERKQKIKDLESSIALLKAEIARLNVQHAGTTKIGTMDIISAVDPARKSLEKVAEGTDWVELDDAAKLGLAYEAFYSYPFITQKNRRNRAIGQLLAKADSMCQKVKSDIARLGDKERQQFPASLIVGGIDVRRRDSLSYLRGRQSITIKGYPVEAAVRDVLDYHNKCTLLIGLGEAREISGRIQSAD